MVRRGASCLPDFGLAWQRLIPTVGIGHTQMQIPSQIPIDLRPMLDAVDFDYSFCSLMSIKNSIVSHAQTA